MSYYRNAVPVRVAPGVDCGPVGSAMRRTYRTNGVIYRGAAVVGLAGFALLALTSIGLALVFLVAGSVGLFGAALTRRSPPSAGPAIPAQSLGNSARRRVGARQYIPAYLRIKVAEKPDPKIQILIQRAVDDAGAYGMRLH